MIYYSKHVSNYTVSLVMSKSVYTNVQHVETNTFSSSKFGYLDRSLFRPVTLFKPFAI